MGSRLEFQQELETLLGTRNVYFQPPASIKLKYPAIVYELGKMDPVKASNVVYLNRIAYDVTYIDKDPDNTMKDKLLRFPYSEFSRFYVSDNLNHYTFTIYY